MLKEHLYVYKTFFRLIDIINEKQFKSQLKFKQFQKMSINAEIQSSIKLF